MRSFLKITRFWWLIFFNSVNAMHFRRKDCLEQSFTSTRGLLFVLLPKRGEKRLFWASWDCWLQYLEWPLNKNHHIGWLAMQYPVSLITWRHGRCHSFFQQNWLSRRCATIPDLSSFFPWITMTPASLYRWALRFASPPSVWPTGPIHPRWERRYIVAGIQRFCRLAVLFYLTLPLFNNCCCLIILATHLQKARHLSETPEV